MADRPILFSAPMVTAQLAGRKNQTRRLLRIRGHKSFSQFGPSDTAGYDWHFRDAEMRWHDLRHRELLARLPWQVGDRLWVRETWACHWSTDDQAPAAIDPKVWSVRYLADGFIRPAASDGSVALAEQFRKTRVSIHMPRWASRLTLTVTDVRVQRLQEMTDADAMSEGIAQFEEDRWHREPNPEPAYVRLTGRDPRATFHDLWNSLHGPGAWEANPHVIALTFTVARRNIDADA